MDTQLNQTEIRVLGCLMEKEMATPDYYPLTLNALTNGCNQKSNRNPVVSYDEETVLAALEELKKKKIVRQSSVSRALKYEQIFTTSLNMIGREQAIMCVLLLRGPQTAGEIRGRTERLYPFADLDEVKKSIASLEDMNLVKILPREPGRKESRYAHMLSCDEPDRTPFSEQMTQEVPVADQANNRLTDMEQEITMLKSELAQLRAEFLQFKAQFD